MARGEAALEQKQWELARAAFARGRALDPTDAAAARGEGIALLNLGQRLEAEADLRVALGRDPDDALALFELGQVFFAGQHYTGAARFWSQVLEEDPKLATKLDVKAQLAAAQRAPK